MINALNMLSKILRKINVKHVRSTLNSTQNMKDLRFIRIAALTETKVLWHKSRRGDKQTGGQQFESNTQLEINSSSGRFDFL